MRCECGSKKWNDPDLAACFVMPFMIPLWLYTSPQSCSLAATGRYWLVARRYFTKPLEGGTVRLSATQQHQTSLTIPVVV